MFDKQCPHCSPRYLIESWVVCDRLAVLTGILTKEC